MLSRHTRGASLVEALVAVSIIVIVSTGVISVYPVLLKEGLKTLDRIEASLLAEEGIEAIKTMRDTNWTTHIASLTASTTYYLAFATSSWAATTTNSIIDSKYFRSFAVYTVSRDVDDDIVASGGTNDPDTRMVTVWVGWPSSEGTTTEALSTYITNLFGT